MRTLLAGHATIGNGHPDVPCQVRDLSESGARITIADGAMLPDRFQLRMAKSGLSHSAEVRWRGSNGIGVEFVVHATPSDGSDPVARVQELEAENAELRRRVAELTKRLFAYGDTERLGA